MTFDDMGFGPNVRAGIRDAGYESPTPIQSQAIPVALEGHDLMGIAQTGTGKTAAFALPILEKLSAGKRERKVRALIVCPTRELAEQIFETFSSLGAKTGLRTTTIYGGVGMQRQIDTLKRGVDIVVACPGRLLDHLQQGTISLDHVETLVLDEADQMLDMGFLPPIEKILRRLPTERQSMLFSATMPAEIRSLSSRVLRNPKTVQIGHVAPAVTVSHAAYQVSKQRKLALLLHLLEQTQTDSVLVFMRTKHAAKKVAVRLEKAGYASASLQGNLSQNRRQAALDGFRSGETKVLVATDIAARGIDVSRVSHVINFDVPETAETYTHRIGRTGRAERTGEAITFITPDDAWNVKDIERLLGKPLPRKTAAGFDYTAKEDPADAEEDRRPPRPQRQASRRPFAAGGRQPQQEKKRENQRRSRSRTRGPR